MTTSSETPDDGLLAAEYVLRLMPPREESAFEDRLAQEPGLMGYVTFWATRLSGMNDEVAPVAPPSRTRRQLMERLFGPTQRQTLWQRTGLWQALSFAAVALAAFMALQMLRTPEPTLPGTTAPLLISEIAAEDQSLRVLAVYDPNEQRLTVTRTAGQAALGRALELWAIAEGAAPVSLGVLPDEPRATLALPADLREQVAGLTLAISDEPPGGSTTGAPTGAVLAVGQVTEL
ncbi:anti-sigma factor [Puniceibacterium confluentis]|uniref:anti-sigma factor n=1 Tax=Puniceibacterium confluentis TaxID=1958944 RepID=UPI0011B4F17E|nr:anti-sigma factor [Puniceibacterium confluentis]